MNEFVEVDHILDELMEKFILRTKRSADRLKALTMHQEIIEELSSELVQAVASKVLFLYGNQRIELLRTQLQQQDSNFDDSLLKVKLEIIEGALRIKSVDYLRNLVPVNTNIAQHALFSANPRSVSKQLMKTVHGVRSVHIKNNTGQIMTTYEARVMGAVQSLWFKKNVDGKHSVELKYSDILQELGLSDGSANYRRIQDALLRLMNIEVTLMQYQKSKDSEYEEIALTRLINEIVFRRKVGSSSHYQYKFEIKLPDWLIEANKEGNLFDVSLILMNDLKSYLAQGLYWLVSSYPDQQVVTLELSVLAGHFHFLDQDGEPIMKVFKIIERIKEACEELQVVGFIDSYLISGKKQGLADRFLTLTKNPIFISNGSTAKEIVEQLELFDE